MVKMPWKSVLVSLVLLALIASLVGIGVASPIRTEAAFAGTVTGRILVLVHGSADESGELPDVRGAIEKWGYPVVVFDHTEYYDLAGTGGHWYLDDQGGGHGNLDLVVDGNMLYSTIIFDPHDGEAYTDVETSSRAVKQMFQDYPFLGIGRMESGYAWNSTNNVFQVSTDGNVAKSLTVSNPAGIWALEPLEGYQRTGSATTFNNITGKSADVTVLESFDDGTPALTLASYAGGAHAVYFAFKDWGYAAHASMLVRIIQQYSGVPYIKPYYALEIDDCGRGVLDLAGYTSLCNWTTTNFGGYPTFAFMESYLDSTPPEGIMVWGLDPMVHTGNGNYEPANIAILAALKQYKDHVVASHGYQHDMDWWKWTATNMPVDPYADTDGDGLVNWHDTDLEGVGVSNSLNPNLTMFQPGAFVMPDLAVQELWLQRMREVLDDYGYSGSRVLVLPKYEHLDGYTQELASEYGFTVLSGRGSNENYVMTLGWVDGTYAPGRVAPSGTGTDTDVALTAVEQQNLSEQFMGYAGSSPLVLVNLHDWQLDDGSTSGYQLRDSYLSSLSVMQEAGFSLVSTQTAANKNIGWLWTDMTSVLNSSGGTSLTLSSSAFQDGKARHELDIVMPSSIRQVKVGSNYWIYVNGKNLFYGKQSGSSETLEVSSGTYDSSLPRITSVSTPATDVLNAIYDPVNGKVSLVLDGTFSTTLGISNFKKPFAAGTTTIGTDGNVDLSLGLSGVASVDSVNMSIVPSISGVDVAVQDWSTSGDRLRRWSETFSSPLFARTAHTMGDLIPGKSYNIYYTKGSGSRTYWQTLQANSAGQISFSYSPLLTTTTTFELQAVPDAGPTAAFWGTPTGGSEPLTVAFADNSTSGDGIAAWLWSFGDGQTSTEQNPTHVYAQDGTYTVTLTVTEADADGDVETKAGYVTVSDAGPSADFSASPATGAEPLTVALTDLSTSHDGIVSWLWDFGDGQTSTEQNPTHVYAQDGTYTVTLTVTEADADGDVETKAGYVTVSGTGPAADFSATPTSGTEPLTVVFADLSSSYDGIVSWLWDFGDGQTSMEQNPTHVYAQDGTYAVTLTVTEADADSDTETKASYVTVSGTGPAADFSATPTSGTEPLTVVFTDASTSYDGIVSWLWDFGDGQTSTEQNPTHVYAQDGTYTVTLTVTEADADSDTETKASYVTVSGTGPAADFSATPTSGTEPLTVVFADLSASYDGIVTWLWDFGDGQTSTEQSPTHVYAQDGTYTVTLTVTEADGDSDTETKASYVTATDGTPPAVPALLAPANGKRTTDSTPWLDWSDVSDPSGVHYELQVDDSADFSSLAYSHTWLNGSSHSLATALADGVYYWRVRAVDGAGNASAWASALTFTVDSTAPAVPALLAPANGKRTTDTTPWLDWSDVTDLTAVHYQLQVDDSADFSSLAYSHTWLNGSSHSLATALADGVYYWRVRAVDGAGNASAWASALTFTVDSTAPAVPALLAPANGKTTTDSTPWLDWSDVTDLTAVHYQLQVDDSADFSSLAYSHTWLNGSSHSLATALADGVYYWRVRAVDGAGNASAWASALTFTVDSTAPAVPALLVLANGKTTTDSTPWLDWSDVSDPSGVHYQLQVDDSTDFSSLAYSHTWLNGSSHSLATALADGVYYWRVRAVDGAGNASAWTDAWSFTVQ